MDYEKNLGSLIAEALRESADDEALARALIANGAVVRVLDVGAYDTAQVQERLGYSSDSLRAQISKARRGTGALPLPRLDGRFWAREEIDAYKQDHARKAGRGRRSPRKVSLNDASAGDEAGNGGTASSGDIRDIGTIGVSRDVAHAEGVDPDLGEAR